MPVLTALIDARKEGTPVTAKEVDAAIAESKDNPDVVAELEEFKTSL